MDKKPRYRLVAQRIGQDFAQPSRPAGEAYRLPGYAELAERYNVSYGTISSALKLLRQQGRVVRYRGGVHALVSRTQSGIEAPPPPRADKRRETAGIIREKILAGEYVTGTRLPKISYFAESLKVSPNTVCKAITTLEKEWLIHKQGKNWMVGSPSPVNSARQKSIVNSYAARDGVVVVIARNMSRYYNLHRQEVLAPFFDALLRELTVHSIGVTVCYVVSQVQNINCIAGTEQIISYIRRLGERYMGCLVAGSEQVFAPDLFYELARYRKPVLWLDPNNYHRTPRYRETMRSAPIVVCRSKIEDAVTKAVTHLHTRGHYRIGVAVPEHSGSASDVDWPRERLTLIREVAGRFSPRCSIVTAVQRETFFCPREYKSPLYFLEQTGIPQSRLTRGRLMEKTPSLRRLLERFRVTALLALNDTYAHDYYLWCSWARIRIPQDLSIVSFDNRIVSQALGLTTVDLGYFYAGYRVARILLESQVPPRGKPAVLESRPWLINRGTVTERA